MLFPLFTPSSPKALWVILGHFKHMERFHCSNRDRVLIAPNFFLGRRCGGYTYYLVGLRCLSPCLSLSPMPLSFSVAHLLCSNQPLACSESTKMSWLWPSILAGWYSEAQQAASKLIIATLEIRTETQREIQREREKPKGDTERDAETVNKRQWARQTDSQREREKKVTEKGRETGKEGERESYRIESYRAQEWEQERETENLNRQGFVLAVR